MALCRCCQSGNHACCAFDRHEQPCLVADDLSEAALGLVPVETGYAPTVQLNSLCAVDQAAFDHELLAAREFHGPARRRDGLDNRSEEHTSELQSLMRI